MTSQIIIVCDTQQESAFATQLCQQRGYQVVNVSQPQNVQLLEVDSSPNGHAFSGKYARMGQSLFVVTAQK